MWPHSANWTPENPHPPTVQHAYTHAHTPHLYLFLSTYYDSQNIAFFLKGSLTHSLLCKGLIKTEESHSGQTNSTKKWKAILVICLMERFSFCPRLYVLVQDCCQIVFSFLSFKDSCLCKIFHLLYSERKRLLSAVAEIFFLFRLSASVAQCTIGRCFSGLPTHYSFCSVCTSSFWLSAQSISSIPISDLSFLYSLSVENIRNVTQKQ